MRLLGLLLLVAATASAQQEVCCDGLGCFNLNPPFDHNPVLPNCPEKFNPTFDLFTRSDRSTGTNVPRNSLPPEFDSSKPHTIFIIHGWNNDKDTDWLNDLKERLLNTVDANVIRVGWGGDDGSNNLDYPEAAATTRVIGAEVALRIQSMKTAGANDIRCIGHSLGAHSCGLAGTRSKLNRIIGMDPAGPLFDTANDRKIGLHPDAADYTQAIHTHGKGGSITPFGTMRALGHVDFYPNGGGIQPGCEEGADQDIPTLHFGCSHGRSIYFTIESISNTCFFSRSRCTDTNDIPGSCSDCGGTCATMGWDGNGQGLYYLTTTATPPFCTN